MYGGEMLSSRRARKSHFTGSDEIFNFKTLHKTKKLDNFVF
jgi:hypothetical protein